MPKTTRIEFHEDAVEDLAGLDKAVQARIRKAVLGLASVESPRDRLIPYEESLSGYWKLRVGDYRLVCQLSHDDEGNLVLVVMVVHRSKAYLRRTIQTLKRRSQ